MRSAFALCLLAAGCDDLWHLRHVPSVDGTPATPPGLLAHYNFEDSTVGTLPDVTSQGHDGSCGPSECPTVVPSVSGHGVAGYFNASKVVIPSFTMGTFTVTFWMRIDQPGLLMCPVNRPYGLAGANSWQLCALLDTSGMLMLTFYTSEAKPQLDVGPLAMPLDSWHHVAVRWDGATKALFYDHALVGSGAGHTNFDDHPIVLGADIDNGVDVKAKFIGALDDVAIYGSALTDEEIATATP